MYSKCQLEVKITYSGENTQEAIKAIMVCLEDDRFWARLQGAFQQDFRDAVLEMTGESHDYMVAVEEHDLLRYLRKKAERYEVAGGTETSA